MVVTVADVPGSCIETLLGNYGLSLVREPAGAAITGSFWGDDEAGIVGLNVFARDDTPIHSLLHEACHTICMSDDRRESLDRDAGGDDLEEAAVCYLQILLADHVAGVGRERLMQDMDAWGYSFRLGSTARWFADDAEDARKWLIDRELINDAGEPTFRLCR
mgnify:CR=1 FL=1